MHNSESLLDSHGRAHESLRRLMASCASLTIDELHRPLSGRLTKPTVPSRRSPVEEWDTPVVLTRQKANWRRQHVQVRRISE
jgi:hypothetical protein